MYNQSDIRKPVTDEAICEHRRQYAVGQAVRDLVVSRNKSAPAELVQMLHGGENKTRAWIAISSGLVNRHDRSGAGVVLSFAGLCFARGRVDILRAIVEAGQPQWMRDLPRMDDPRVQYIAYGAMLPESDTRECWLRTLTFYQATALHPSPSEAVSLYRIATNPVGKHSAALLNLALDADPDHPDAAALKDLNPEGAALLTQLQMERRIRSSASVATQENPVTGRASLRRRAAI